MSEFNTSLDEQETLARLRDALQCADPVPNEIAEFARASFLWRDIGTELTELDLKSLE